MPSYPQSLTITNPGAETGDTTGWTNVTGTLAVRTSGTGGLASHSGGFYFIAGATATTECRQDISLDSSLNTDIDANKLKITLQYWHAGAPPTDTDAGAMALEFYDGSNVIIGGRRSHPSEHEGAAWNQRTLVALIPPNTRKVRLIQLGTRNVGTNLDSYIDDITATIDLAGQAYGVYGCDLWLKGSAITDADGVAMSQWNDSSGNAFHVTASGTARPLSRPSGNVHLNSKPTAEASNADGAYDKMTNVEACLYAGNTGLTVIAVVNYALTGGTNAGDIVGRDGTNVNAWRLSIDNTNGPAFFQISTGSGTGARIQRNGSAYNFRGTPYLVSARYNGSTGEQSIWVNSNLDNGTIDGTPPATVSQNGAALGVFGVASERFAGHIAEILVFGRALTDTERSGIEAQLLSKYKLYRFIETALSPNISYPQGIATDGTNFYATSTSGGVRKFDASWATLATNSSPYTGIGVTVNHLGDCFYYNGKVYAPAANSGGPPWNMRILEFDASTLARTNVYDVSGTGFEYAAIAVDTLRNRVWCGSYQNDDQLKLWWYNLSDFSFGGSITLTEELTLLQGLTYNPAEDSLWASLNDERIARIDPTTGTVRQVYQRNYVGTGIPPGESEGVDFSQGTTLYWLTADNSGSIDKVHTLGLSPTSSPGGTSVSGQLVIPAI